MALTPFVLPGEQVRVAVAQRQRGVLRARLEEIQSASPDRVKPGCPYFGRCGGCHYQHASYEAQLAAKRSILIEELRRIGKIEPPEQIEMVAGEPWAYRNRSQFHIEGEQLGYREARSHKLCPIEHCPISSPRINEVIGVLRDMLRDPRWPRFVRSLEVFTNESAVQLNVLETERPVARRFFDWCAERIPGYVDGALPYDGYRVSRESFFQVNRFLITGLVEAAVNQARGASALDLYAGVGLFSRPLPQRFEKVTAVESSSSAARDLEMNVPSATVVKSAVEEFLMRLEQAPDFILLDPPRAGIGKAVVQRLAELRAPRLAIVACDPATLARDLSGLIAAGYQIERLMIVDLFPQTYHFETVVHLVESATAS